MRRNFDRLSVRYDQQPILAGAMRMIAVITDKRVKQRIRECTRICKENSHGWRMIGFDMGLEYVLRACKPEEYTDFQFVNLDRQTRRTYVTERYGLKVFAHSMKNHIPQEKDGRYLLFANFFQRDVLPVRSIIDPKDCTELLSFLQSHKSFVVKPHRGTKGHGFQMLRDIHDIAELEAHTSFPCLLEEVIEQGDALKRFHPQSVNTVRMVTGMSAEGCYSVLFSLLRTGRGDSLVDNVGSGGLVALIDPENGRVVSNALCNHRFYSEHPDTGVPFEGYQIPDWRDCLEIARAAHSTLPEQRLIGWDFAWTTKGWDLIEANPAPAFASYQSLAGIGIRPLLVSKGLL